MQTRILYISCRLVAVLLFVTTPAVGQNNVFVDTFDLYCDDPNPSCTDGVGDSPNLAAFLAVWQNDLCDNGRVDNDTGHISTAPFSIKQAKDGVTNKNTAARNKHVFTEAELLNAALHPDPNPNALKGTTTYPIHLYYRLDLGQIGWFTHNRYVELVCGDDRAPTNTLVEDPVTCDGKHRVYLDPNGDGTVHGSIAVGVLALSDNGVCTDSSGQHQVEQLTVYDGRYWHYLKPQNMRICKRWVTIELWIKENTFDVRVRSKYNEAVGDCSGGSSSFDKTITMDRQYTGAFTGIVMGGLPNDSADPETGIPYGGCWDEVACDNGWGCTIPVNNYVDWLDDLYVQDGESFYTEDACGLPDPTAACCRAETGTCDVAAAVDCVPPDIWREGEACGDTLCCPQPWADIDLDNDVDLVDFGLWQVCFTGDYATTGGGINSGCECFDRDDITGAQGGDGLDIDGQDFVWFENCFTGPTVPMTDPPPAGCIP